MTAEKQLMVGSQRVVSAHGRATVGTRVSANGPLPAAPRELRLPAADSPGLAPRLLVADRDSAWEAPWSALPALLPPGALVMVNDAATLPGALPAGEEEVRLLRREGPSVWIALRLGAGDSRQRTEDRPAPRPLSPLLEVAGLTARAEAVHGERFVRLHFQATDAAVWRAIYTYGRPVQYAHVPAPLALWSVQTAYAGEPWAAEMPSAGRGLRVRDIMALRARGVEVLPLTHAAGLSSSGDADVDALLPWRETYRVSAAVRERVQAALAERRPIIAVGTSVVRALESLPRAVDTDTDTELRLGPDVPLRVVSGLLTGWHELGSTHFSLLETFRSRAELMRIYTAAERAHMRSHEFGDLCLLLPSDV